MTKRNLVVKNGLQVGDVIISATDNTIVGLSTTAPSNSGDVVTKSYSDSGTQTFTNKTFDANGTGNSISNIETADFASAAFKDEDTMSSDSATAVASQQSIKAYVDSKANTDSTITADMSTRVFGVISSQPAYAMNAAAGNSDSHPFVAMTGRTPVRVIGPVAKGQRLVSSSTKGTARAINDSDITSSLQIIGRALEDKHTTDIGLVNCVVRTNN